LVASGAQTARNAAQKALTGEAGVLGAALTRFLYGLPFAALWLGALAWLTDPPHYFPRLSSFYLAWMLVGATAQALATMCLLAAMRARTFLVAVTLSKTELVQVAILGALLLGEVPSSSVVWGMLLAGFGVALLFGAGLQRKSGQYRLAESGAAAAFGLAAGAGFAVATIAYRGAGLDAVRNTGLSVAYVGAFSVVFSQLVLSVAIIALLGAFQVRSLAVVLSAWRVSMAAGLAGAVASTTWLTAYIMRPAADVKTLGMVEIVISYCVGRYLFKERLSTVEGLALGMIALGALAACFEW